MPSPHPADSAAEYVQWRPSDATWTCEAWIPESPRPGPRYLLHAPSADAPRQWMRALPAGPFRLKNLTPGPVGPWVLEATGNWDAQWAEGLGEAVKAFQGVPGPSDLPGLFVTDMDSTLIDQEVIDELARCGGRYREVAKITEQAMRGELDFEASLRARVAALAGLDRSVFETVRLQIQATAGAPSCVRALRSMGCRTAVVSGGFMEVVEPFAAELGLDHAHANRLELHEGRLTGELTGTVVDAPEKARFLGELAERYGLPVERVVAVGDGANDVEMIRAAGVGIAFCAKPALREAAFHRVDVRRLDHCLHLWGMSDQDVDWMAHSSSS